MSITTSEPLRGNNKILATFKLDAGPAAEMYPDLKAFALEGEDADDGDLTYQDVEDGTVQADTVNITAIQSLARGSFWRFCWDNAGKHVVIDWAPHGNAIATDDKPHFRIDGYMGLRPNVGGEARKTKERQDFETVISVNTIVLIDDPVDDTITDGV